jgi:hypothetical protein
MCGAAIDVRFGPKADSCSAAGPCSPILSRDTNTICVFMVSRNSRAGLQRACCFHSSVPANRRQATPIRAAENQKSKSAGSHADSGRVVLDFPGSRSSVFQVLVTEKSPTQFIATGLGGGAASKDGEALTIEFDGDGARLWVTLPATLLQQMQLLFARTRRARDRCPKRCGQGVARGCRQPGRRAGAHQRDLCRCLKLARVSPSSVWQFRSARQRRWTRHSDSRAIPLNG